MRTTVAGLIFVCAAVLAPLVARADTPVRRTIERSGPAAAHVRVEGSTGDVAVVGDDGTTVRVTARVRASSDDAAAKVNVDLTHSGDESVVTVNVPQSSPSFVSWIFDRRHVSVDLVVRVPRRSGLVAHLSTGDLDVRGLAAAIDVRSSTGDVHLHDVAADASATTSTGDVVVDLAPDWRAARLTARTATGDVRINAPSALRSHVHVQVRTGVGDVRNALGNADVATPSIEARTSVGDVTIAAH
jgi:DUF4097 and DUF4098 domain-containing protein YvlB